MNSRPGADADTDADTDTDTDTDAEAINKKRKCAHCPVVLASVCVNGTEMREWNRTTTCQICFGKKRKKIG